jgi:type VI secretion system protein ImpF
MAEARIAERLQPFLLDRLTDDSPSETAEGRDDRVFTARQSRQALLRDLGWLLNGKQQPRDDVIYHYPEAANSVLNFGMPDMAGRADTSTSAADVERAVRASIATFEPRIDSSTLLVRTVGHEESGQQHVLTLEIQGEMWALPVPDSLWVRTQLDLETGQCAFEDRRHG